MEDKSIGLTDVAGHNEFAMAGSIGTLSVEYHKVVPEDTEAVWEKSLIQNNKNEMSSHIIRQLTRLAQIYDSGGHKLLIVNTISSGLLLGGADIIQQSLERRKKEKPWDTDRTFHMLITGCSAGPLLHYWYLYLDKIIPRNEVQRFKVVITKVAVDQTIAPFFAGWYFIIMALLQGHRLADGIDEFRDKFWDYYLAELAVWPAAQMFNFLYLPSKYRVLFVNVITLGWNVYLSYLKHRS
ncbi:mpv17-like protein 2 [Thamnophis elegans]|uniref:mpv17-like protein 2 n=1 Tax=Thamnophis elegans TaxID=35005 RepID=UPI001376D6E8|nr:mpv17-like protein 2 [Thamnophis elegans]